MLLRAQVSLWVRKRDPTQLRVVMTGNPRDWPPHLQFAWTILDNDLAVPAQMARALIARSINAAQACATRMNESVQQAEQHERAGSVKRGLQRLSNCARRAP